MILENLFRVVKSMVCATGAAAILMATCNLCGHISEDAGGLSAKDRVPRFLRLFVDFVPGGEIAGWAGLMIFAVGYGCVAWQCRPTALQAIAHAVLGFFAMALVAYLQSLFVVSSGITEVVPGAPTAPFAFLDHSLWFAVCFMPLVVAVVSWRMMRRDGKSSSSAS